MRFSNLLCAVCCTVLFLITFQQAHAEDDSPWIEQYLIQAQRECERAGMYLAELMQKENNAKMKRDRRAYRSVHDLRSLFEKGIYKRVCKNYLGGIMPPPLFGHGGECTSDPGPCLKCENGYIIPDDGDNPKKRCYRCQDGKAVQDNGHPCNDYNPWTENDVCQQGSCKGTRIILGSCYYPGCM